MKISPDFDALDIDAEDSEDYDLFMEDVPRALAFLDKHLEDGRHVLVHCYAGMNRSAAVCAALLLLRDRRPLAEAVRHFRVGWAGVWWSESSGLCADM